MSLQLTKRLSLVVNVTGNIFGHNPPSLINQNKQIDSSSVLDDHSSNLWYSHLQKSNRAKIFKPPSFILDSKKNDRGEKHSTIYDRPQSIAR